MSCSSSFVSFLFEFPWIMLKIMLLFLCGVAITCPQVSNDCSSNSLFILYSIKNSLFFILTFSCFSLLTLVQWAMVERLPMPRAPGIFPDRTARVARWSRWLASPLNTPSTVVTLSGAWPLVHPCQRSRAAVLTLSGIASHSARTSCCWQQAWTMVASRSGTFTLVRKHWW